ncbi:tyrosine-type recombinase/integrase [Ancylobacter sp. VNQ12]|uniref:tyrosine-type recombinase/integrase n=1 Tax=Ancylobacter sp. VNQ12 TaxID=3400920 RepID=UPI003BFAEB1B
MTPAATCADLWAIYWVDYLDRTDGTGSSAGFAWRNLSPHFGQLKPAEIDYFCVRQYRQMRAAGSIGRPSTSATIRRELVALLAALRWCASPERRFLRPDDVPAFDLPPDGAPRQRWLRNDEIEALLAAAVGTRRPSRDGGRRRLSRAERFLWIALHTAARKEAILDLSWDRVDFETGTIDFNVPGRRVTKKRRVVVPIASALLPILERAYRERQGDLVLDNKGAVWATVQSIAMKAGLAPRQRISTGAKPKATGISPHVLRHTAATHMARSGVPLWKIAKFLGNSVEMVDKVYAKFMLDDLRGAAEVISQRTNGAAKIAMLGERPGDRRAHGSS